MPSKSPAQARRPYHRPGGVSYEVLTRYVRPHGKNNHQHEWESTGPTSRCEKCGEIKPSGGGWW